MSEADEGLAPGEQDAGSTAPQAAPPPSPARMVPLEQQVGWGVVAGTATAVVYAWVAGANGKSVAISAIAIGLAMAAVLGAAVWYGRRMITAFAAMAAGAVTGYSLLSIVCVAYGAFLLFRNTLAQRKLATTRPRRPPRARSRSSKASAAPAEADGTRRPSANRRYTPPKSKTPRRAR